MNADKTTPSTIDEYIAGFPPDIQEILQKIRQTVRMAAPDLEEEIKYAMPSFGSLIGVAAWKKHIAMYPIPAGTKAYQDEIAAYQTHKSTLRFPLDQPIPYDLIRQTVEFRVKENKERLAAKEKGK